MSKTYFFSRSKLISARKMLLFTKKPAVTRRNARNCFFRRQNLLPRKKSPELFRFSVRNLFSLSQKILKNYFHIKTNFFPRSKLISALKKCPKFTFRCRKLFMLIKFFPISKFISTRETDQNLLF